MPGKRDVMMNALSQEKNALAAHQIDWLRALSAYAVRHPDESQVVATFADFMRAHADAARRERASGHLTGSAWLVSADGRRVLLTHHRKLGRWLQLGGHADGEVDLARVALREAQEESGLNNLAVEAEVFDIDRHEIPARDLDPAHWHYDVRYVVRAAGGESFVVSSESLALAWREVTAVAQDPAADESLRRMARKWLGRS